MNSNNRNIFSLVIALVVSITLIAASIFPNICESPLSLIFPGSFSTTDCFYVNNSSLLAKNRSWLEMTAKQWQQMLGLGLGVTGVLLLIYGLSIKDDEENQKH